MKKILLKAATLSLLTISSCLSAQVDLTIGINYSYNPPTGCNNKITALSVDICNGGSSSASSFIVGIYLFNPGTSEKWVIDQTTVNSLSGNACITINNWDINMDNYCCLPAPASNYRIGVWADTANVITETSKSNNASLLSGNIQVCASSVGLKNRAGILETVSIAPNPSMDKSELKFVLATEEKVSITVSDITGKAILNVYEGMLAGGEHIISLNTNNVSSGIYFINIHVAGGEINKKLIIQK